MAIDLNDAPRTAGRSVFYDKAVIDRELRRLAEKWVPELFPNGYREREGGEAAWRVANIKGDRPKDKGSCRIWLTGEHAGEWFDFQGTAADGKHKGGPTSAIKNRTGLEKEALYDYLAELIIRHGGRVDGSMPVTNASSTASGNGKQTRDHSGQIQTYLEHSYLANNSPVEIYWRCRQLGELPASAYRSPDGEGYADLVFNPDAINFDIMKGTPALIHKLRDPSSGQWTGAIHVEHLRNDGSWHIGPDYPQNKRIAKKTWGAIANGAVAMLAQLGPAGELAIGEGIETTAAGMVLLSGVPGWATCGTEGLVKFGERLAADRALAGRLGRLCVLCDTGKGGEAAARRCASLAAAAGVARVELYMPRSGNDMAADLAAGYIELPPPITEHAPADRLLPFAPGQIADAAAVQRRLADVKRGIMGDELNQLLQLIAGAQLSGLDTAAALGTLARKVGITKKLIEDAYREVRGSGGEVIMPAGEVITLPDRSQQEKPWLATLALDKSSEPKGIMANVAVVLREAREIKGSLGFNNFTGMIWITKKMPWEIGHGSPCDRSWTDNDELAIMEWVQRFAGIHAAKGVIFDAVQRVSSENSFHPVREYLNDVRAAWSGKPRIDYAACRYFGAADTEYNREVFRRWMLSAVVRIMEPGAKVDSMVVFEGEQGTNKSTSIRVLFDPNDAGWFTDQLSEIGSKDASIELRGIWCAEYSDLSGMIRTEARVIKRYMSQTFDRFRPPYGRMPIRAERQCVFAGSTNDKEYLKDETGARRFWPLVCGDIDRAALIAERHEIWGEVMAMYETHNYRWWIDEKIETSLAAAAAAMSDARYQADAWESVVIKWLSSNGRANITVDEIMRDGLGITDLAKWSRNDQVRIGFVMRRIKWIRARDRAAPFQFRYWRPGMFNPEVADAV